MVSFLASFLVARHEIVHLPRFGVRSPIFIAPIPDHAFPQQGAEIAFVFIGAPTCVYSNASDLPPLIEEAKYLLREQSTRRGVGFATIGVSPSRSARAGLAFLGKFGAFDELSAGRAWYNDALLKYVYQEFVGPPVTPQILLVERMLGPEVQPGIHREHVLLRQVGLQAIRDWVRRGAPVPQAGLHQGP